LLPQGWPDVIRAMEIRIHSDNGFRVSGFRFRHSQARCARLATRYAWRFSLAQSPQSYKRDAEMILNHSNGQGPALPRSASTRAVAKGHEASRDRALLSVLQRFTNKLRDSDSQRCFGILQLPILICLQLGNIIRIGLPVFSDISDSACILLKSR